MTSKLSNPPASKHEIETCDPLAHPDRVTSLLKDFEAHGLTLIEWEIQLFNRLGYPLATNGDYFFLLPDEQLQEASDIAAKLGLHPADNMRASYTSESSGCAIRYILDDCKDDSALSISPEKRLVLLPLSWTGISNDETTTITDPLFPCTIHTVPIQSTCAAFIRLACRERRGSSLRSDLLGELSNIIAYRYFDTTYEGDYMEILTDDVPRSDKEIAEMDNAVAEIKGWHLREEEQWMVDALVQVIKGEASYDNLPWETRDTAGGEEITSG